MIIIIIDCKLDDKLFRFVTGSLKAGWDRQKYPYNCYKKRSRAEEQSIYRSFQILEDTLK